MSKLYNEKDPGSIERHGKALLRAGTLRRANCAIPIPRASFQAIVSGRTRGFFGKLLEENYYGIEPGNSAEPDFPKARVELKSTPLVLAANGLYKAKERLVLGIINYRAEAKKRFAGSLLRKNENLMLVSYEHRDNRPVVDHPVRIAQLIKYWDLPKNDRLIIERDWAVIHKKIMSGKAHEISEGDTFYLAACTKGADGKSMTPQYGTSIWAKTRAFSFKPSYMTAITRRILNPKEYRLHEPVIRNAQILKRKTLEKLVEDQFAPFIGKPVPQIHRRVGRGLNVKSKDYLAQLARRMLGIKGKKIEEFEKAGVVMKTIQLNSKGTPKEAMSFPYFDFKELVEEKWDGEPEKGEVKAGLQTALERKFLFVVFQREKNGKVIDRRLQKVFFWNMPANDLETAHVGWRDTQRRVSRSNLSHLLKISDKKIIHVRPHGRTKRDTSELPNGTRATKRCFWLNQSYVSDVIRQN